MFKQAVVNALASMKASQILHRTLFPHQLTILCYHAIVPARLKLDNWCFLEKESFRQRMEYLKAHFRVLPLSTALDQLVCGKIDGADRSHHF